MTNRSKATNTLVTSFAIAILLPLALGQVMANDKLGARILTCETTAEGRSARIEVTERGAAFLKVGSLGKGPAASLSCRMHIRAFDYRAKAAFPHVRLQFDRAECEPPSSKEAERQLLKTVSLIIRSDNKERKRLGRVQWLRHHDSMPCDVGKFEKQELMIDAKLWSEGKWGD